MSTEKYIPALKYHWLTTLYDPILDITMPERKIKSYLINEADFKPEQRVLDFGCGSLTLSILAKKTHPATEFVGVDVDKKILQIAREKGRHEGVNVPVIHYDGSVLPFKDSSFDHVMSSLVFHHLTTEQKASALAEIKRVLKPTGQLHIADFGSPANLFQRVGFYLIQFLDGFKTTTGSVKGVLPDLIFRAGFFCKEIKLFKTAFGTVRLTKSFITN